MAVAAEPADLELTPTLEETRALAREHTLVPVRHTFIADTETPVSAYLKLRGEGPSFLLESAEQGPRFGRWSFLGYRPRTTIRIDDGVLTVGGEARAFTDPYAVVALELERYRTAPLEGLPPFAGGAVGLFGYDLVRFAEPTRRGEPNPDPLDMPDMALMVSDVMVAFDHLRHEATILANVFVDGDVDEAYAVGGGGDRRGARAAGRAGAPVRRRRARRRPEFESNTGERRLRGRRWPRAWSTSAPATPTRWCPASAGAPTRPADAFSIYRGLRAVNPSPYMYFLDFEDFQIAGASPEALVKVEGRTRHPAADRRHPPARRHRGRGRRRAPRSCWPTRRSAPST